MDTFLLLGRAIPIVWDNLVHGRWLHNTAGKPNHGQVRWLVRRNLPLGDERHFLVWLDPC